MIDKLIAVRRDRIGQVIGRIDEFTQLRVDRLLAVMLGLAG
jgi:hypothetical protein